MVVHETVGGCWAPLPPLDVPVWPEPLVEDTLVEKGLFVLDNDTAARFAALLTVLRTHILIQQEKCGGPADGTKEAPVHVD